MNFPTLFKLTTTGAVQFWTISSNEYDGIGLIETSYGQIDTDKPQITSEYIEEGKNIGKKNETTAGQQAQKEAEARWKKQLKKGYVESIEAAKNGQTNEIIEGGIVPMLAHKFSDHSSKIQFPCLIQPKLDGIRCIAILKDGKCTLWSRTRKPITSMPHIVAQLESLAIDSRTYPTIFDGELYNHRYKNNFEEIVSKVRQEEPDPDHAIVEYHIYDIPSTEDNNKNRWHSLEKAWAYLNQGRNNQNLKLVETSLINEDEIMTYFEKFRAEGYEGAMLRNTNGKYVNKRSYDLQKVKEFDDDEFHIIGIEEGRGKLKGHVGAFVCRTDTGKEFLAKMSGDTERLKEYFINHSLWQGKTISVKYQGLTSYGIPRFPVGIAIRDYE